MVSDSCESDKPRRLPRTSSASHDRHDAHESTRQTVGVPGFGGSLGDGGAVHHQSVHRSPPPYDSQIRRTEANLRLMQGGRTATRFRQPPILVGAVYGLGGDEPCYGNGGRLCGFRWSLRPGDGRTRGWGHGQAEPGEPGGVYYSQSGGSHLSPPLILNKRST